MSAEQAAFPSDAVRTRGKPRGRGSSRGAAGEGVVVGGVERELPAALTATRFRMCDQRNSVRPRDILRFRIRSIPIPFHIQTKGIIMVDLTYFRVRFYRIVGVFVRIRHAGVAQVVAQHKLLLPCPIRLSPQAPLSIILYFGT